MEIKNFSFLKKFSQSLKLCHKNIEDIFQQNPKPNPILLPESIRYKLAENGGDLTGNDIKDLLYKGYQNTGVYLVSKLLLTHKPYIYIEFLNLLAKDNFESQQFEHLIQGLEFKEINGVKVRFLSMIGFETESFFQKELNAIDHSNQLTPCIILNAGILGFYSVFEKYNQIYLYDYKQDLLFKINKTINLIKRVDTIELESRKLLMIDDMTNEGKTKKRLNRKISVAK